MAETKLAPFVDRRPIEALDLATSEAQAAQWLLEEIEWGGLSLQLQDTDTAGWLRGWAIDALKRTLTVSDRAVRKLQRTAADPEAALERTTEILQTAAATGRSLESVLPEIPPVGQKLIRLITAHDARARRA